MTTREFKCCVAETIGTFAIVFFGCGAIATNGLNGGVAGHVGVNLVFGITVVTMIFALGHISCAHFNPAVTLGFALSKRFPWRMALPYIVAQCIGAHLAAASLTLFVKVDRLKLVHFGATLPSVSSAQTLFVEVVITFFLMLIIISVATDKASKGPAGLPIGGFVALAGLMAGPITGSSMNPARSLAPALFAGGYALSTLWIYVLAPCVGAALGALTYEAIRRKEITAVNALTSCCAPD